MRACHQGWHGTKARDVKLGLEIIWDYPDEGPLPMLDDGVRTAIGSVLDAVKEFQEASACKACRMEFLRTTT